MIVSCRQRGTSIRQLPVVNGTPSQGRMIPVTRSAIVTPCCTSTRSKPLKEDSADLPFVFSLLMACAMCQGVIPTRENFDSRILAVLINDIA